MSYDKLLREVRDGQTEFHLIIGPQRGGTTAFEHFITKQIAADGNINHPNITPTQLI